jgi:hypothetical protein
MERLFTKIKKEALSQDEKTKIFSTLQNFVNENPIKSTPPPFYISWSFFGQKTFVIPAVVTIIIVLIGSGTVFAAQNSLPNDMLYPIKMLSESMQSFAATDTKTKAQIEASHAISRLNEVEQIVNLNKQINKETEKEIGNNFGVQLQSVTANINKLKSSGQTQDASIIWSDFKKSVAKHEKTITDLSNSTTTTIETQKELSSVISDIHSQLEKTSVENGDLLEKSTASSTIKSSAADQNLKDLKETNVNSTKDSNQIQGEVKGASIDNQIEAKQAAEMHQKNNSFDSERADHQN